MGIISRALTNLVPAFAVIQVWRISIRIPRSKQLISTRHIECSLEHSRSRSRGSDKSSEVVVKCKKSDDGEKRSDDGEKKHKSKRKEKSGGKSREKSRETSKSRSRSRNKSRRRSRSKSRGRS